MLEEIVGADYAQAADALAVMALQYAVNFGSAIAVLLVGLLVARFVERWVRRGLSDIRGVEPTVRIFISRAIKYVLWAVLLVVVLAQFGVQTTSIIAALGAAGLAIGLALQGTLANIAAGIMLLVLSPFRVGDYIVTGTASGTVEEIGLFVTNLTSADGLFIAVPNSLLWNTVITNFSRNATRRMEFVMRIAYTDDIDTALQTLQALVDADERVLKDPAPFLFVKALDDSAVAVALQAWTRSSDFQPASTDLMRRAKLAFEEAGLTIPFPQRDVHVHEVAAA